MCSIFEWHNETINIWSHLISTVGFIICLTFTESNAETDIEIWPLQVLCLCAIFCYGFSAIYHTFQCHSENAQACLCRIDMQGIFMAIAGNNTPLVYYQMAC